MVTFCPDVRAPMLVSLALQTVNFAHAATPFLMRMLDPLPVLLSQMPIWPVVLFTVFAFWVAPQIVMPPPTVQSCSVNCTVVPLMVALEPTGELTMMALLFFTAANDVALRSALTVMAWQELQM